MAEFKSTAKKIKETELVSVERKLGVKGNKGVRNRCSPVTGSKTRRTPPNLFVRAVEGFAGTVESDSRVAVGTPRLAPGARRSMHKPRCRFSDTGAEVI